MENNKNKTPHERALEKIKLNRHKSQKWNELYLRTFHVKDLENGALSLDNGELTTYHGKSIACLILRKNANRSCADFDYRLYMSCLRYDIFNGDCYADNIGGEDVASTAILALQECIDKGATNLDDTTQQNGCYEGCSVFKYVCFRVNQTIHKQQKNDKILTDLESGQIENYKAFVIDSEDMTIDENATFLDIIDHLKLTPIQMRYLDYIAGGMSKREVARTEKKDESTVRESFKSIATKFIKYCHENDVDEKYIAIINRYLND